MEFKSTYLSAIQSLEGETPHQKHKFLSGVIKKILENEEGKNKVIHTGITDLVKPPLYPYIRILLGIKLKVVEIVLEALKSTDINITNQAFKSKWFFNSQNNLIQVDYMMDNVIPYISVRTRRKIIKKFAICLRNNPQIAEGLFNSLTDAYGQEQSQPLLLACTEDFIFESVLKHQIILPIRLIEALYIRYPDLIIRFLELGNENNSNKSDRRILKVPLLNYVKFLPHLIKHHTAIFVKLFLAISDNYVASQMKFGSNKTKLFLKHAKKFVINQPNSFLRLLQLKEVTHKLTEREFSCMIKNVFPENINYFHLSDIYDYLKYYPEEKKSNILIEIYYSVYGNDLLESEQSYRCFEFFKILSDDLKYKLGTKKCEIFVNTPEYYDHVYYLPPKKSIAILKEALNKPSKRLRSYWIKRMIISCSLYNSKSHLLDVLIYFNERHKNEQIIVTEDVLRGLIDNFEIMSLDKNHCFEIFDIIQRSYVNGTLKNVHSYTFAKIIESTIYALFKQIQISDGDFKAENCRERLASIAMEYFFEYNKFETFLDSDCTSGIKKDVIDYFLRFLPIKYPDTHEIWNDISDKLRITTCFLQLIHNFNNFLCKKLNDVNSKSGDTDIEGTPRLFYINHYFWLRVFVKDILKTDKSLNHNIPTQRTLNLFKKIAKTIDPDLYHAVIDIVPNLIRDIESNDANGLLKLDASKVLVKWEQYLKRSRKKLYEGKKCAKRFILSTKWYNHIPVKFVEKCVKEIKTPGSILVLGILLESESFIKVVESYLVKCKILDIHKEDSKEKYEMMSAISRACNFVNPPVSFEFIASFCQGDYTSLAGHTLTNMAQRHTVDKVLSFAYKLTDNNPISIKKLGIRLIFQVSTKFELLKFLKKLWIFKSNNPSFRELLTLTILKVFKRCPSLETWGLMKLCISELTVDDLDMFITINEAKIFHERFLVLCVEEIISRLDQLSKMNMCEKSKQKIICNLVENVDESTFPLLPENLLENIMSRYFLEYPVKFTVEQFLFSNEEKFEKRLNTFMEITFNKLEMFNQPHKDIPRYYPTNQKFHNFVKKMTYHILEAEYNSLFVTLVGEVLDLFTTKLFLAKEPLGYIALNICKIFLEAKTPEQFAKKVGANLRFIIDQFQSEIVLDNVASFLSYIVSNQMVYKKYDKDKLCLTIIEGMTEEDMRYGAVVAFRLLNPYDITKYDHRYDQFIETCRKSDDVLVLTALNYFINQLEEYHCKN